MRQPDGQCEDEKHKGQSSDWPKRLILLVGAAGFELAIPCTKVVSFIRCIFSIALIERDVYI